MRKSRVNRISLAKGRKAREISLAAPFWHVPGQAQDVGIGKDASGRARFQLLKEAVTRLLSPAEVPSVSPRPVASRTTVMTQFSCRYQPSGQYLHVFAPRRRDGYKRERPTRTIMKTSARSNKNHASLRQFRFSSKAANRITS